MTFEPFDQTKEETWYLWYLWIFMNISEYFWIFVLFVIFLIFVNICCEYLWIFVNICEFLWILENILSIYMNICEFLTMLPNFDNFNFLLTSFFTISMISTSNSNPGDLWHLVNFSDNLELEFMTIFLAWQLRVTVLVIFKFFYLCVLLKCTKLLQLQTAWNVFKRIFSVSMLSEGTN